MGLLGFAANVMEPMAVAIAIHHINAFDRLVDNGNLLKAKGCQLLHPDPVGGCNR